MESVFREYQAPFSLLDVGCGCGGLATALQERFQLRQYMGVDISKDEIDYAKGRNDIRIPHSFMCEDICKWKSNDCYDVVTSFSCIDFNDDVMQMLNACYDKVAEGGYLIASFRLTDKETILNSAFIPTDPDDMDGEKTNYVVFSLKDLLSRFYALNRRPDRLQAYGYWGVPNPLAVVPYEKLCFAVFAIHKPENIGQTRESYVELELPTSLFL